MDKLTLKKEIYKTNLRLVENIATNCRTAIKLTGIDELIALEQQLIDIEEKIMNGEDDDKKQAFKNILRATREIKKFISELESGVNLFEKDFDWLRELVKEQKS